MRKPKHFYVYIMTNNQRFHVLYTGITGDLPRRVFEHKHKLTPGFTSRYNLTPVPIAMAAESGFRIATRGSIRLRFTITASMASGMP